MKPKAKRLERKVIRELGLVMWNWYIKINLMFLTRISYYEFLGLKFF
jgi:hypothetical protein